jgi:TetR/AcrR family transcriptional regulator, regulator of autoinduction and epiphytic fitness
MSKKKTRAVDPRIERTRHAVRQATLEVLGSRGYAAFTVDAVAESARVAKSTIYRHWPTKLELIADALETLNVQPRPQLATGPARAKIEQLIEHLTSAFTDSILSACIPALIEAADHHPEVADFLHGYSARRRQTLVDVIQEGIDSGELPRHLNAELAALALSGPVIYCRTMTPTPLPVARSTELVTQVLGPPRRASARRKQSQE